jgi:rhomboid protease GluP
MKELLINDIGKNLIENKSFFTVNTSSFSQIVSGYTFVKDKWGALYFINFIDMDYLDLRIFDDVKNNIYKELSVFKEIIQTNALVYVKVFVTEKGISENDKVNILSLHNHSTIKKQSIVPVIIDMTENKIISASDKDINSIGLQSAIYTSLRNKDTITDFFNLEEIQNVSKDKYEYSNVDNENKPGKPYITYLIISLNIIMFIITSLAGGLKDPSVLTKYGAKINSLIIQGEYWRLLSCTFLHNGIAHIVFNMYGLLGLGTLVEKIYGRGKFIFVYFIAAISGSILSFIFSIYPSVGASGAIFGLFGALLYFGQKHPKLFSTSFGANIIAVLLLNLFIGFTSTGIDNYAHLGGLIGGYLSANIVGQRGEKILKNFLIH